jgi:thioredoxin 1
LKDIESVEEFEKIINTSGVHVIDFWAEWCGPCRMTTPVLEELDGDFEGTVNFYKLNVDSLPQISSKYTVFAIPTIIVFDGKGEILARTQGAASKESYRKTIEGCL